MVFADESLITQVIVNLLKNASQAVSDVSDKQITISSRIEPNQRVVVEICNNGLAIPKEIAEDIFTPFFTTRNEGSGIGLSVSRQIMHLHGGKIRLVSNKDNNVTFAITF